jgi:hypothetical protein
MQVRLGRYISVHILVALTYIGKRPYKAAQVRHWDDNKVNNAPSNLLYGSQLENMADAKRNGIKMGGAAR